MRRLDIDPGSIRGQSSAKPWGTRPHNRTRRAGSRAVGRRHAVAGSTRILAAAAGRCPGRAAGESVVTVQAGSPGGRQGRGDRGGAGRALCGKGSVLVNRGRSGTDDRVRNGVFRRREAWLDGRRAPIVVLGRTRRLEINGQRQGSGRADTGGGQARDRETSALRPAAQPGDQAAAYGGWAASTPTGPLFEPLDPRVLGRDLGGGWNRKGAGARPHCTGWRVGPARDGGRPREAFVTENTVGNRSPWTATHSRRRQPPSKKPRPVPGGKAMPPSAASTYIRRAAPVHRAYPDLPRSQGRARASVGVLDTDAIIGLAPRPRTERDSTGRSHDEHRSDFGAGPGAPAQRDRPRRTRARAMGGQPCARPRHPGQKPAAPPHRPNPEGLHIRATPPGRTRRGDLTAALGRDPHVCSFAMDQPDRRASCADRVKRRRRDLLDPKHGSTAVSAQPTGGNSLRE